MVMNHPIEPGSTPEQVCRWVGQLASVLIGEAAWYVRPAKGRDTIRDRLPKPVEHEMEDDSWPWE